MSTVTETHTAWVGVVGTDQTVTVHVTGPYYLEQHGSQMLLSDIDPNEGDVFTCEIDGFTVTLEVTDWETDDDGNEVPTEANATIVEID